MSIALNIYTSMSALNLLSSFEVMWRELKWNGEFSPTKISVRHCSVFNPSVMSDLLKETRTIHDFKIHFRLGRETTTLRI